MEVERARCVKIATARKEITALHHKTAHEIHPTQLTDDMEVSKEGNLLRFLSNDKQR